LLGSRRDVPRLGVFLKWAAIGLGVLSIVIQFVPYGRDHSNPVGGKRIAWDSKRTQRLMTGACMDCHSSETRWPWYSNVAPVSWLVQKDVDEGRGELNLSTGSAEVDEMIETIREGSMPPWQYSPRTRAPACLHARSRTSSAGCARRSGRAAANAGRTSVPKRL
jgi:hypothetical protein